MEHKPFTEDKHSQGPDFPLHIATEGASGPLALLFLLCCGDTQDIWHLMPTILLIVLRNTSTIV